MGALPSVNCAERIRWPSLLHPVLSRPSTSSQHVLDGTDELAVDADQAAVFRQRERLPFQRRDRASLQHDTTVRGEKDRFRLVLVVILPDQLDAEFQAHRYTP